MTDMLLTRQTSEILTCNLTPEEHRERGRQLAEALEAVDKETVDQKAEKEAMKDRLEHLQAECDRLGKIVREEKEDRSVNVRIDYSDADGMVYKYRLDTGEMFASRKMTDDERQRALPFPTRKVN